MMSAYGVFSGLIYSGARVWGVCKDNSEVTHARQSLHNVAKT